MKVCSRCRQSKKESDFTKNAFNKDGLHYYCKNCYRIYMKEYTKYRNSPKGQEARKRALKKFFTTEHGKEWKRKMKAKRRGLGYIKSRENIFAPSIEVEWHHIDDTNVIALPKDIHHMYSSKKYHRENLTPIITQLYGEI